PLEAQAAMVYVDALRHWRDERKRELDELDQTALSARDGAQLTGDIALSMALWQAVSDRYELLAATWNSGRAGVTERERMATLIWGRLGATINPGPLAQTGQPALGIPGQPSRTAAPGLAVSLPEACRLSDALLSQLRVRL